MRRIKTLVPYQSLYFNLTSNKVKALFNIIQEIGRKKVGIFIINGELQESLAECVGLEKSDLDGHEELRCCPSRQCFFIFSEPHQL